MDEAPQHCCDMMTYFANFRCPDHPPYMCGDYIIRYAPTIHEYRILIHDDWEVGPTSGISIKFCPWCGVRLPDPIEPDGEPGDAGG